MVIKNNSNFADIAKWLKKGIPPIVDWFSGGRSNAPLSEMADGHASVVCGLDDTHIYLQDPEIGGMRKIIKEDFKRVWFDFRGEFIKSNELVIRQIVAIYK